MSNPAQVEIADIGVYLYTHLNGHEVRENVGNALARAGERTEQPDYLARIILDELKGEDRSTTGFGIDTTRYQGVYRTVTVDVAEGEVTSDSIYDDEDRETYGISEFIEVFADGN